MTDHQPQPIPEDRKAEARRRLAAARRRTRALRRRVAAGAAAVFMALFATVYVQMASGNDPVLTAFSARSGVAVVTTTKQTTATTTSSSSSVPAPVTTSQS
jgi:hypothetical protein